jgi:Uma2 family endonuclease
MSAMVALPEGKLTVDEYLAWAEGRPGRYELHAGTVYAMAPERAGHARLKFAVQAALLTAIRQAGLACHMLPDGMNVRIDRHTAHEPDALVYCGDRLPDSAVEVPNPLIVVEVLSPSTRHIDASAKLAGYFSLESVRHYLIIDPNRRVVIHHQRGEGEQIATRIVSPGPLRLDPPGIELRLADIFEAAP